MECDAPVVLLPFLLPFAFVGNWRRYNFADKCAGVVVSAYCIFVIWFMFHG